MTTKSRKASADLQTLFFRSVVKSRQPKAISQALQREAVLALRGTLTQAEAASIIGKSQSAWTRIENASTPIPAGLIETFREKATARFPHYRCDLKRI